VYPAFPAYRSAPSTHASLTPPIHRGNPAPHTTAWDAAIAQLIIIVLLLVLDQLPEEEDEEEKDG
jgi:hypothetical protein